MRERKGRPGSLARVAAGRRLIASCALVAALIGARTEAQTNGRSQTDAEKRSDIHWNHPLDVLELYLPPRGTADAAKGYARRAAGPRSGAGSGRSGDDVRLERIRAAAKERNIPIEAIVATVPDPVDSRTAGSFDQALNAIQRAAAEARWLLDRHYLPWTAAKRAENKQAKPQAVSIFVSGQAPDRTPVKATLGSVFPIEGYLQRESPAATSPREHSTSPPAGGRSTEVYSAEDSLIRDHEKHPGVVLFRKAGSKALLVVFLVGETQTWGVQRRPFRAAVTWARSLNHEGGLKILGPWFSGSADSIVLELSAPPSRPGLTRIATGTATATRLREVLGAVPRSQVRQLVATNDTLLAFAAERLRRVGGGDAGPSVAFLVENDSSYGRDLGSAISRLFPGARVVPTYGRLSGVRSEWSGPDRGVGQAEESIRALERISRLSLEDTGAPTDGVPQVAVFSTASVGATMGLALERLRSAPPRFVCIIATDVRDRIFLARLVHRRLPDARLVLFEANALYAHPDVRDVFEGALVFAGANLSDLPARRQHTEPLAASDLEVTAGDALHSLLDDRRPGLETRTPVALTLIKGKWHDLEEIPVPEPGRFALGVAVAVLALFIPLVAIWRSATGRADYRLAFGLWAPSPEEGPRFPQLGSATIGLASAAAFLALMELLAVLGEGRLPPGSDAGAALALCVLVLVIAGAWSRNRWSASELRKLGLGKGPGPAAILGLAIAAIALVPFVVLPEERILALTRCKGVLLSAFLCLGVTRVLWSLPRFLERWHELRAVLWSLEWRDLQQHDFVPIKESANWKPMSAFRSRRPGVTLLREGLRAAGTISVRAPELLADWLPTLREQWRLAAANPGSAGPVAVADARLRMARTIVTKARDGLVPGQRPEEVGVRGIPGYATLCATSGLIAATAVFAELRSRLVEILLLMGLLGLGARSFSFTPRRDVTLVLIGVALLVAATVLAVLREIDRNAILSWASGGTAGSVEWKSEFVSKVLTFSLGPLLLLLATQVPWLAALLAPVLDVFSAVKR